VFADTPQITRKPGDGAVRHASNSRPVSSGDSQVDRARRSTGRSVQVRMRTQIASIPYRLWYSAAIPSVATLDTP
jgi:hypothetical protein